MFFLEMVYSGCGLALARCSLSSMPRRSPRNSAQPQELRAAPVPGVQHPDRDDLRDGAGARAMMTMRSEG
ncbi:MAG: hypothetical protein FWF71_02355 [Actinomycetia bacterium]|nr:hypothetical protein [Actinomycetes bacterium]